MSAACEVREVITDLVVLDNEELSFKARGLLLHLTVTYAPGTQVASERLMTSRSGEGRQSLRGTLLELEKHGYMRRGRGTAWVFRGDPTRLLG